MLTNVLTVVVGATVPVVLGVATFSWQQRVSQRQRLADEQDTRVRGYLTLAYQSLSAIGPAGGIGNLTIDEKRSLERSFSDAYLYGDDSVVTAMNHLMNSYQQPGGGSLNPVLQALRDQLRESLKLEASGGRNDTPYVTTGWRFDEAAARGGGQALTVPSEALVAATGLSVDELLKYVQAGSLARPSVDPDDGTLRFPAGGVQPFLEFLLERARPEAGS